MDQGGSDRFSWIALGAAILFFSAVFAIGLVLHGLFDLPWQNWRVLLKLFMVFAVLGAFYGTIAALDCRSDMAFKDRPVVRTLLCGVFAAVACLLFQAEPLQAYDPAWMAGSFVVGAALGCIGWRWAKYVDF